MSDDRHAIELPVVGAMHMDRRHALKIMAIAAARPGLSSGEPSAPGSDIATAPAPTSNPRAKGTAADPDLNAPRVTCQRTL